MTETTFFIPSLNMMGAGCLTNAVGNVYSYGFRRALIVTDSVMNSLGVADKLGALLAAAGVSSVIFPGAQPNPTVGNVEAGLALLQQEQCDCVISLGGGSSHDCAKGIALTATNGGSIRDYEGVDKSAKAQLPLIAINTTAGTASEMTRFCIITDEQRMVKMAIVDRNVTPLLSVNDPELMLGKPPMLTAATGMDALTHAVEAYVSVAATPITDACALKAVSIIAGNLRTAVAEGNNLAAREAMAYAGFMAGMAFNNASLGFVHAMAHQLGGFYDLPHGVCNAVLLPHVEEFNADIAASRLKDVAHALGVDTLGMSDRQGADACIAAIRRLSADIGIPSGLTQLGVKDQDIPILAANALKDACGLTNPRRASQADIESIFRAAA
ncbi:L-threonine dehydrogenase [Magnetospirillum fulvum]|uniref:Alcohol dehydrogenase 2 n=1 Tax=Magnetospirillum fulvum TaxID=1082 RepID=A0A1H6H7D3_MAGFU|nr:L-threonine dehydrogenase [Magnetospirillum fulvum]SEH29980.1 alcohol dehydrogenase [Magnetospirillum fulvum]